MTTTAKSTRMRLGWFINFLTPAWNEPWSGDAGATWMDGSFFVDMARSLDRAGFDVMMLEDSNHMSDTYGGTFEGELKHTVRAPKNDPVLLLPLLAQATERLGFVATMSTSFYPPYLLARSMLTLDHLTGGRVGWNVVTSYSDLAAKNFGAESLPEHDERYEIAEEYVDVVKKLWASWDPDAVVMDKTTGRYVDHTKVHTVDHKGKYFSVRGPLNTLPPVQRRPVICQAGGSPKGREFAARNADMIVASPKGIDEMRDYRDEIRSRAERAGRNPDDVRILYMISPFVEESDEMAQRLREERRAVTDEHAERRLLMMTDDFDFAKFPLDEPLPDYAAEGKHGSAQSGMQGFVRWAGGRPLGEAASRDEFESFPVAGTPSTVADRMQEVHEEVGGDGFLLFAGGGGMITRRYIDQITEGLVPELRRRGLVRTPEGDHLIDRLSAE